MRIVGTSRLELASALTETDPLALTLPLTLVETPPEAPVRTHKPLSEDATGAAPTKPTRGARAKEARAKRLKERIV